MSDVITFDRKELIKALTDFNDSFWADSISITIKDDKLRIFSYGKVVEVPHVTGCSLCAG